LFTTQCDQGASNPVRNRTTPGATERGFDFSSTNDPEIEQAAALRSQARG
jgi:hypothetical protein